METSDPENFLYDFKIYVQNNSAVDAHKIVLASQTSYFAALFRKEKVDSVRLEKFRFDIVKNVIDFLYTGSIELNSETIQDTTEVANYLMVEGVMKKCDEFIVRNLDTENVLDVLLLGYNIGSSRILDGCLNFICHNFDELYSIDSYKFFNLPSDLVKRILDSPDLILYDRFGIILPQSDRVVEIQRIATKYQFSSQATNGLDFLSSLDTVTPKRLGFQVVYKAGGAQGNTSVMGRPGDQPQTLQLFKFEGKGNRILRALGIRLTEWDGRQIVAGLELRWSDEMVDKVGGGDEERTVKLEMGEKEHMVSVLGQSGWYVDQLIVVTSKGRVLGPVGGDGGGLRNTLSSLDSVHNVGNMFLDGVEGKEVMSQGKKVLTGLKFIYRCIRSDQEKLSMLRADSPWYQGFGSDIDSSGEEENSDLDYEDDDHEI